MGRKKLVRKAEPSSKRGIAWPRWTGFRGMTARDWLQLLVVPLALVVISFLFTAQQDQRQQQIENNRAESERKLTDQRAQDEALQAYLDQMSVLLLEKNLRDSEEDSEARTLARARTLTVLRRLDPSRKTDVIQFLLEANLVEQVPEKASIASIVILSGGAVKQSAPEGGTVLAVRLGADLSGVDLARAELITTYLPAVNLSGADLQEALLNGAELSSTKLSDADLSGADLSNAKLSNADLSNADLSNAKVSDAGLSGADLSNAKVSDAQLKQASHLEGATMPNGQKYEDWLKDKEGRKDGGENGGAS